VIWVNPDIQEEEAIQWLEKGASADHSRRLENYRR